MAAKKKKRSKKTKAPPASVKTISELARRLGRNRGTVSAWRKRPGFPCPVEGPFNVAKVDRWAAKWRSASANRNPQALDSPEHPNGTAPTSSKDKPLSTERAEADLEFRRLKIEREKLKNQELAGDLVPRSEIIELLVARAHELRRNLSVLPRNVTSDADLQQRIRAELEDALREYTREPEV